MKKEYYPQSFIQSLILFFVPFLFCAPFVFIKKLNWFSETIFSITLFGIYFLILIIFYYFKNNKSIYFNYKINKTLILFISIIITFQIGIHIPLNLYLNSFFNPEISNKNELLILSPLIALIITAIIEEFIFRGIILKGYLMKFKAKKAIIISSIFFSLIHFNFSQIPGALILGITTGYIYYYTRSVGMTIILHIIYNIMAFLFSYLHNSYGKTKIENTTDIYGNYSIYAILIASLTFICLLYYLIKNKTDIIKSLKILKI